MSLIRINFLSETDRLGNGLCLGPDSSVLSGHQALHLDLRLVLGQARLPDLIKISISENRSLFAAVPVCPFA